MVDLHLVSWNRPAMTALVINTIWRNTDRKNFKLHVFDNGSDYATMRTLNYLVERGMIDEIVTADKNVGLEKARQYLLEQNTHNPYFVCIDNDCLPCKPVNGKDWLERLIELMEKYEDYAAISCRTQVMIGTGNIFEEADKGKLDIVDFPHPGGSLRIMRTSAVREVRGWDRGDPGRGSEERYICGKLRDAGYKTAFAAQIPTLHLFGLRDDKLGTDRWGYQKNMKPEETGHSDIDHPALRNGDDFDEVVKYAGKELAESYFGVNGNNKK